MTGFASLPPVTAAGSAGGTPAHELEVLQDIHGLLSGRAVRRADRRRPEHGFRHPGLPRARRRAAGPHDLPGIHRRAGKPAALLGPQPHRLVASAPGGSERRPCRCGPAGAAGAAHRPHHPKRGPAPRGRRQRQRGGPARPVRPGGVPGLPPARTAAGCWPASWRNSIPGSWNGRSSRGAWKWRRTPTPPSRTPH